MCCLPTERLRSDAVTDAVTPLDVAFYTSAVAACAGNTGVGSLQCMCDKDRGGAGVGGAPLGRGRAKSSPGACPWGPGINPGAAR